VYPPFLGYWEFTKEPSDVCSNCNPISEYMRMLKKDKEKTNEEYTNAFDC